MPRKIIIDVDPGIGGALAIITALRDPTLDVLAVTATSGCVSADVATRNLQAIIEQIDPSKWPRLGAASEFRGSMSAEVSAAIERRARLHGRSGLGDRGFEVADLHHRHESAKLLTDLVRAEPNELTLLTLGPLTNVAVACERSPDFLSKLGSLVCLGGSVTAGGDANAAAEFNIFYDPQSAREILRSSATKTIVPLDVSNKAVLTFEEFNRLNRSEADQPVDLPHELMSFYLRAHHEQLGLEGIPLREVVALATISRPRLFASESMAVDIETRGELTRGMTVFDRRATEQWQTNIDVVREIDARGVLDYFAATICNG